MLSLSPQQRHGAVGLGLVQIVAQFLFDEVREFAISGAREMHAVPLAQHADFTCEIGAIGRIRASVVGKARKRIDELETVEIGALAHDLVHHLRLLVGFVAREIRQANPVDRGILALQGFHHPVDAAGIFRPPFRGPDRDQFFACCALQRHPVVLAQHDDGDVQRLFRDALFEVFHLGLEVCAHDA